MRRTVQQGSATNGGARVGTSCSGRPFRGRSRQHAVHCRGAGRRRRQHGALRAPDPADPEQSHCRHFVKAKFRTHEDPDGSLAIFHGPHRLARYTADGTLHDPDAQYDRSRKPAPRPEPVDGGDKAPPCPPPPTETQTTKRAFQVIPSQTSPKAIATWPHPAVGRQQVPLQDIEAVPQQLARPTGHRPSSTPTTVQRCMHTTCRHAIFGHRARTGGEGQGGLTARAACLYQPSY